MVHKTYCANHFVTHSAKPKSDHKLFLLNIVPEAVADGVGAGVVVEVLLDDGRDEARRQL